MPQARSVSTSRSRSTKPNSVRLSERIAGSEFRFGALVTWLIVVFVFGGSSRADVGGPLIIRPLAVLFLGFGLAHLNRDDILRNRFILLLASAWLGLLLLQLVPLPPELWRSLGGREIIWEIGQQARLGDIWRPLSMAPFATRDAFWASLVPLSVIVSAIGLDRRDIGRLVPVIILLTAISAMFGVFQIIGDPHGPLYLYRFTHNGLPVGLFANRNHQALLLACSLPMLAAWGSSTGKDAKPKEAALRWFAVLVGVVILVPMILLTGSRSGAVVGLVALMCFPLFVASDTIGKAGWYGKNRIVLLGGALAGIIGLTLVLGRALSVDRLLQGDAADDMRVQILPTILSMIDTYFPWGTGIGTFVHVFRIHEPDNLLGPSFRNQAHNDWLDLLLTGGIPAMIPLAILLFGSLRCLPMAWNSRNKESARMVRLGLLIALLFAIASITDYPLRMPSLACLGALALVWAGLGRPQSHEEDFASANV